MNRCSILGHKWEELRSLTDSQMFSALDMGIAYDYPEIISDFRCKRCGKLNLELKKLMDSIKPGVYAIKFKSSIREERFKKLLEKSDNRTF